MPSAKIKNICKTSNMSTYGTKSKIKLTSIFAQISTIKPIATGFPHDLYKPSAKNMSKILIINTDT